MKIRDVMTKDVHLARPADTIQEVAGWPRAGSALCPSPTATS